MKTDRELLELVAKAAGITGYVGNDIGRLYFCTPANPDLPGSEPVIYYWLYDDGDALRLAVKLHIDIKQYDDYVVCWYDDFFGTGKIMHEGDALAATRRAIVRAAAAIGEAK